MKSISKEELEGLKQKLESIEQNLETRMNELEKRQEKWKKEDDLICDLQSKEEIIVRFTISGKNFSTRLETLTKKKDNLLYKIIVKKINEHKNTPIVLNRNPKYFGDILNYLRFNKVNIKKYSQFELEELLEEAKYFDLTDLEEKLNTFYSEIKVINFTATNLFNNVTPNIAGLLETSQLNGICVTNSGSIVLELDAVHDINEVEVGGYKGTNWSASYGVSSKIWVSLDGTDWEDTNTFIPSNFNGDITKINIGRRMFKFIKFTNELYMGIGYLKFNKFKY